MTGAILTDEDGDGDFDLKLTGLNDGNQYTVTVLDQTNDPLTNVEIDLSDDGQDNPSNYIIGDTLVIGSDGSDTLSSGDDGGVFFGNAGDDQISGGAGVDQLSGNLGDDILEGRAGNDVIDGGAGTDEAVFVHGTQAISAVAQTTRLEFADGFDTTGVSVGDTITLAISYGDGASAINATVAYTISLDDLVVSDPNLGMNSDDNVAGSSAGSENQVHPESIFQNLRQQLISENRISLPSPLWVVGLKLVVSRSK